MLKRQKRQARVWSFLLVLLLVLQDGAAVTARAETGYTSGVQTMQTGKDREEEKAEAAEEDEKDASDSGKTEDTKTEDTEETDKEETDPEETDPEKDPETGKEEEKEEGPEKDPEEEETEEVSGNDASDREDPAKEEPDSGVSGNDTSDSSVSGNDVSGNDIPDVSENDPVLREPENYYPEGEEEDYGELVAYDAHSRTYLTGEMPAAARQNGDAEGETGTQRASYVTVIGPSAHHYLDEEGELQKTDNTLRAGAAARYGLGSVRYENGNGPMTVSLPEKLSEREGIYIHASGRTLELLPEEGDFTRSLTAENAIRYNDVFPGIDYQYTVLGESLKEDIILLEETDRNTFSYLLRTDGLEAALSENQVILYEENKEEPVYFLEAPEMEDAAGEMSFGVKLSYYNVFMVNIPYSQ